MSFKLRYSPLFFLLLFPQLFIQVKRREPFCVLNRTLIVASCRSKSVVKVVHSESWHGINSIHMKSVNQIFYLKCNIFSICVKTKHTKKNDLLLNSIEKNHDSPLSTTHSAHVLSLECTFLFASFWRHFIHWAWKFIMHVKCFCLLG